MAETVIVSSAHNAVLMSMSVIRSVVNFFIIVIFLRVLAEVRDLVVS